MYRLDKGWQWNFDNLYKENRLTRQALSQESSYRASSSKQSREEVEQSLTDGYLNNVEAQQTITELTLRILELEADK